MTAEPSSRSSAPCAFTAVVGVVAQLMRSRSAGSGMHGPGPPMPIADALKTVWPPSIESVTVSSTSVPRYVLTPLSRRTDPACAVVGSASASAPALTATRREMSIR